MRTLDEPRDIAAKIAQLDRDALGLDELVGRYDVDPDLELLDEIAERRTAVGDALEEVVEESVGLGYINADSVVTLDDFSAAVICAVTRAECRLAREHGNQLDRELGGLGAASSEDEDPDAMQHSAIRRRAQELRAYCEHIRSARSVMERLSNTAAAKELAALEPEIDEWMLTVELADVGDDE